MQSPPSSWKSSSGKPGSSSIQLPDFDCPLRSGEWPAYSQWRLAAFFCKPWFSPGQRWWHVGMEGVSLSTFPYYRLRFCLMLHLWASSDFGTVLIAFPTLPLSVAYHLSCALSFPISLLPFRWAGQQQQHQQQQQPGSVPKPV